MTTTRATVSPTPDFNPHPLFPDQLPERYGMRVSGDCLAPVFNHGQYLSFSSTDRYLPNDYVALFFKPEVVRPGDWQVMVKRLVIGVTREYFQPGYVNSTGLKPTVIVEALNPKKLFGINPQALLGIHKCNGLLDPTRADDSALLASAGEPAGSVLHDPRERMRYHADGFKKAAAEIDPTVTEWNIGEAIDPVIDLGRFWLIGSRKTQATSHTEEGAGQKGGAA